MHLYRIQEGYIRNPRGITTILYKTIQKPSKNGLPKKQLLLVCDKQFFQRKTVQHTPAC